jgi:hypothetical protein
MLLELGYHCLYSDWLQAEQWRGWSLSPGWGKIILLSMLSRPVLGSMWPPNQWVTGALSPNVGAGGA